MTLLQVRALHSGYSGSRVLHGVDLDVAEGKVLALLGRNGVGKTTLVETIMGIVRVQAGAISFNGRDLTSARSDVVARAGIGLIPQGRRIFGSLTVEENLQIAARRKTRGPWTVRRIYELLPRLAERSRNRGDQLSGGEQQMLSIGRALLGNPRALLVDEPSDGLAPSIVQQVTEVLDTLRSQGVSILLVEQDLLSALKIADDVAIMDKGTIALRTPSAQFSDNAERISELLGVR